MLAAILLTGCASDGGARPFENRRIVSESEALILPGAGGPAVVDVVEKRFSNAVEQTVALSTSAATPGQNFLRAQFFGPMESRLQSQNGLSFRPIQESALRSEMRREVPGVALRASDLYLRNDYGPFGYAFGRSAAGDSCLYGWQQLRSNESERNAFQNSGMVQIRLRLCDSTAGERELLSVMYGYTVNGGFGASGWNPYGEPRAADTNIGEDGNPLRPMDAELSTTTQTTVSRPRPAVVRAEEQLTRPVPAETETNQSVRIPSPVSQGAEEGKTIPTVIVPTPTCEGGPDKCK